MDCAYLQCVLSFLGCGTPVAGLRGDEHASSTTSRLRSINIALNTGAGSGSLKKQRAFERFGLFKPVEQAIEGENVYLVFEQIQGQAIAHLEQIGEKEARSIGLQLCALAEQFHRNGWVYNGFEPYGVVIDYDGHARLIGFDRAREAGTLVEDASIYPSRGYTAPELFEEGAVYDPRSDVYSIGALLQFLLAGESLAAGEGAASLYPVATVIPNFERLLSKALSEDPPTLRMSQNLATR